MRVLITMTLALLALATTVQAQDGPPVTHVILRVSNQASQIVVENTTEVSQWTCGQPTVATPSGTVANPTMAVLDDWTPGAPSNATCRYQPGAGQPLFALPFGPPVYTARAAFRNSVGTGPESAASHPFSRPGAPPSVTPGNLRLVTP